MASAATAQPYQHDRYSAQNVCFAEVRQRWQVARCGCLRRIADRDITPGQIPSDKAPYDKALDEADDA